MRFQTGFGWAGRSAATAIALTLMLSACGGGSDSGGSSGGSATTNTAPTFTSAGTASVVENTAGTAYTASANDAQGDSVTYSIAGGADAAAFTLGAGGALSFVQPPNYDLPGDANGDNVYEVTLKASDGKLDSTLALAITVTNDREGITVKRVATGLVDPVGIASLGSGSDIAVALKANEILKINGTTGAASQYYVFKNSVSAPVPGLTLLGLTRAAASGASKSLYALTAQSGRASVACVSCWYSPSYGDLADISNGTSVAIGTGPDGAAFVAIGDPAGTLAQSSSSNAGKLIRFVVNPDPYAGASVPPDLYLRNTVGNGLHAPSGVTTLPDGRLAVSDRGGSVFDELSLTASLTSLNFGWPFYEGTQEVNAGGAALSGLVMPSLSIPLGSDKRQSRGIVGGIAYTGSIPGIANQYVFADADGRIWSIPLAKFVAGTTVQSSALEVRNEDFKPDVGTIDHPIGFALDAEGTLYILDSDGDLFRVSAA
ncbi:hypothetical protein EDF56_10684 [Novosphingobium sp. PhB165]|uniref:PQQ-dependent sugar dehydrogenase n=1 Tax=Novosphingobium sp. PhB165 TaxID=2485105 RepID=UPI0010E2A5ED|nr:PQQ-dependent sugar dehydrogenase [Novosphingobium sp. PhB165]TCM16972.1 hypothetical protein EDF56_10684 [Novosphingobium sp. PhB165]